MNIFLKIVLPALTSGLTISLVRIFEKSGYSDAFSILSSMLIATLFFKGTEYLITDLIMRVYLLRVLIDPKAAVEGVWFEIIPNLFDRPYAILYITYNSNSKKYLLNGKVFDPDGVVKAIIKSDELVITPESNKITYSYCTDREYEGKSDVFGFTRIDFQRYGSYLYLRGNGQYTDSEPNGGRFTFLLKRLHKKDLKKYINKSRIENDLDEKLIITKIHTERKADVI